MDADNSREGTSVTTDKPNPAAAKTATPAPATQTPTKPDADAAKKAMPAKRAARAKKTAPPPAKGAAPTQPTGQYTQETTQPTESTSELEARIDRILTEKLDKVLATLQGQRDPTATPGPAAPETGTAPGPAQESAPAAAAQEVATAAAEAADLAHDLVVVVSDARPRFAHALDVDLESGRTLTQPERTVNRLGFLAEFAAAAEKRYRGIADDPEQQLATRAFAAEVRQNADTFAEVRDTVLGHAQSAIDERERGAYSALREALKQTDDALGSLRSFREDPGAARTTRSETTREEARR